MRAEKELKQMEAESFSRNNGIVMRMILSCSPRDWFGIEDLINILSAYSLSLSDILDAVGYFEDMGYVKVRDAESKEEISSCDAEWDEIQIRLFGRGKQAARGIISDDGIEL